jgi:hypothetical protein
MIKVGPHQVITPNLPVVATRSLTDYAIGEDQ